MKPYRAPVWLGVLILFILIALGAGGYWFYNEQLRLLRTEAEDDLLAVAELKIDQITSWRQDQLLEAREMIDNRAFHRDFADWAADPSSQNLERILERIRPRMDHYNYQDAFLVSPSGEILYSVSHSETELHPEMLLSLDDAFTSGEPSLSDLHLDPDGNFPHVAVIAPFLEGEGNTLNELGAIIFQHDASQFLYPLIQSWPLPSDSAETLLIRRDGEDVLFLNELRHMQDTALQLKIPLTEMDVPAVMAMHGTTGIVDGLDYRAVPVIAAILPVPDTNWFMISKIDTAEALSLWKTNSTLIILMLIGFAGTAAGGFGAVWQRNAKRFYLHTAELEASRLASERKHRTTLLSVGDGVIVTDREGIVELINPVAERLTGWNYEDARGKSLEDVFKIINEQTRRTVESPVSKVMRKGKIAGLANHTLLVSRNGEEFPIADSGAPIEDEHGNITGVVLVFRDQTGEREAQKKLEENEKRFRTYFEASPTAITLSDAKEVYINVNRAYCEMTGYMPEEVIGRKVVDFTAHKDREAFLQRVSLMKRDGKPMQRIEKQIIAKNGDLIWVAGNTALIKGENEEPLYYLSNMIDISKRKETEDQLKASEERFRQVAEGAPDGIFVQTELTFAYVNPACTRIFGANSEIDLLGQSMLDRFDKHDHDQIKENIEKVIQSDEPSGLVERNCNRLDGKSFIAEISAVCIDWRGKKGTLVFLRDVTRRKAAEDAIRELNATLEQRVEERTKELREAQEKLLRQERLAVLGRLAGSVSHELRNPLGVISNSIYILNQLLKERDDKTREYLDIIKDETKRSEKIIKDMLDFSKTRIADREAADVENLITTTLQRLQVPAGIKVESNVPGELPAAFIDPQQISQVLQNLCTNAIQAMPDGGDLNISAESVSEKGLAYIRIEVCDSGDGMTPEVEGKIFEPLFTTKSRGIGLGLPLCKNLMEANGGSIRVKTTIGKGSSFSIYLPVYQKEVNE